MKSGDSSQTEKALTTLRLMILEGSVGPGERVAETLIAERSGVSRTPARVAMMRLVEEGLLEERSGGGFFVASFSEGDLYDAVEIRGVLEGTAARLAAERGISPSIRLAMERCVDELDQLVANDEVNLDGYRALNAQFHQLLGEASGSAIVLRSLAHLTRLPFAAPNAFVRDLGPHVPDMQIVSQEQHRAILDAIMNRQGARAEALAREHSLVSRKVSALALRNEVEKGGRSVLSLIVGVSKK